MRAGTSGRSVGLSVSVQCQIQVRGDGDQITSSVGGWHGRGGGSAMVSSAVSYWGVSTALTLGWDRDAGGSRDVGGEGEAPRVSSAACRIGGL